MLHSLRRKWGVAWNQDALLVGMRGSVFRYLLCSETRISSSLRKGSLLYRVTADTAIVGIDLGRSIDLQVIGNESRVAALRIRAGTISRVCEIRCRKVQYAFEGRVGAASDR